MECNYKIFVQRVKIEKGFDLSYYHKWASNLYIEQLRTYTKEPIITHTERVSRLIYNITRNTDLTVAGLLHDSIEKGPATYTSIKNKSNSYIASIVKEVSIVNTNLEDKLYTLSDDALLLKLCEKYDNLCTMINYEGYPVNFVLNYIYETSYIINTDNIDIYSDNVKLLINMINTTINYITTSLKRSGVKLWD